MKSYLLLSGWAIGVLVSGGVSAAPALRGTLSVKCSGFRSDKGVVVVKLFSRGDEVPKGKATRRLVGAIERGQASVKFSNLPYGDYALFAFHDENENGVVDHNLLKIPTEALGFSNGFRVTLWSGMPEFEDLSFEFSKAQPIQAIPMR